MLAAQMHRLIEFFDMALDGRYMGEIKSIIA
jgi:hypothetical protein